MVHLTRLELAHPKALPPQGSVYTNFTTGAYGYYNIFFSLWGEKSLNYSHYGVRFLKVFFTDQLIISLKRSSPETRCWSAEKARTFLFIKYGKLD